MLAHPRTSPQSATPGHNLVNASPAVSHRSQAFHTRPHSLGYPTPVQGDAGGSPALPGVMLAGMLPPTVPGTGRPAASMSGACARHV